MENCALDRYVGDYDKFMEVYEVKKSQKEAAYKKQQQEALGLSEEKMIAPKDEKRGKLLLAEILNGGNFGKHFTKYGHFTQQGMAKKYFLKIWRNMHFVRYYPAEALSEPVFRTWHFFWRLRWDFTYRLR